MARWLPYGLAVAGAALVILALVTQLGGESVLSTSLPPRSQDGDTVYTAAPVELEPGLYDLSLRIRRVRPLLDLGFLGWRAEAAEHPGWSARGRLKLREQRSSTFSDASGSKPVRVREEGTYTLRLVFGAGLDRDLSLRLRRVRADYRVPLWLGLAALVIGIGASPALRARFGQLVSLASRR